MTGVGNATTIRARVWDDPDLTVFVTGTTDPALAQPYAVAALTEWATEYDPGFDDQLNPDEWAAAWLRNHTPRVEAGRIIPTTEPNGWWWFAGHRLDRPGAFFALLYDSQAAATVGA